MAKTTPKDTVEIEHSEEQDEMPICGIIMPIANTDGYPNGHWQDVYSILSEAAVRAGFKPNLVSFDSDVGVIQKRIVQNIYSNPIVVCDISSRNANVMLELGMRLAFDMPAIIVKDTDTPYSFDISPIEHVNYPTDLRYSTINEFKEKLSEKIKDTYNRFKTDANYTTFLKHYGSFEVVKIQEEEVSESKYILSQLSEIRSLLNKQKNDDERILENSARLYASYEFELTDKIKKYATNHDLLVNLFKATPIKVRNSSIHGGKFHLHISSPEFLGYPSEEWLEKRLNDE